MIGGANAARGGSFPRGGWRTPTSCAITQSASFRMCWRSRKSSELITKKCRARSDHKRPFSLGLELLGPRRQVHTAAVYLRPAGRPGRRSGGNREGSGSEGSPRRLAHLDASGSSSRRRTWLLLGPQRRRRPKERPLHTATPAARAVGGPGRRLEARSPSVRSGSPERTATASGLPATPGATTPTPARTSWPPEAHPCMRRSAAERSRPQWARRPVRRRVRERGIRLQRASGPLRDARDRVGGDRDRLRRRLGRRQGWSHARPLRMASQPHTSPPLPFGVRRERDRRCYRRLSLSERGLLRQSRRTKSFLHSEPSPGEDMHCTGDRFKMSLGMVRTKNSTP